MTLKNKDGSIYKLSSPNPVMKTQELWTGYTIHNMQWEGEKAEDNNTINPITSNFKVQDNFIEALDKAKAEVESKEKPEIKIPETKIENTQPSEKIERKTIIQPDLQKEETETSPEIEKIFIHLLPAFLRERKDKLYGDSYKTIQYGKPTSFEGVILKQEDLFIEVWTDFDKINIGSVLYPKTNFKRWWKVQTKTPKAGGWILLAVPSDYQPSFDL